MVSDAELIGILDRLLKLPCENEVFELKEAKNDFDSNKLGKYFSALSNEANLNKVNCAWLVLGIADNKTVVGSHFCEGEKKLQGLKKEIGDKTNNRISFRGVSAFVYHGKRVVMFEIPPAVAGVPTSFMGLCYGRDGSSLVALSEEKSQRILSQPRISDWSAEIVEDASLDDLDSDAILKARVNYVVKNPKMADLVKSWDDVTFLNKALVTKKGKITNTAILLLGKPESKSMLKNADAKIRWILKDKDRSVLDYYIADGPFILEVENVLSKIRNLKYRYMKRGTLFPDEVDMYDNYSIREALHNAIAHQDYSLGVRITFVEMPDRLIFSNAGSFLPGSVDEVIRCDAPSEVYRNKLLVDAMRNLNMVDTIGSGIKRIFEIQKRKFFPMPDYDLDSNMVKVTIFGKILDEEYANILAMNPDLTLSEIMLLDKVSKHQEISKDAADYLRRKKLIEGRRPYYYLSKEMAEKTGQRVKYSVDRGLDKKYYLDLIVDALSRHKRLSRGEVDELIIGKLPDYYDSVDKKRRKVEKLLGELKASGKIAYIRKDGSSYWFIKK
ncbi:MAG: ATP-binding protein [Methanocorpusculum sp.]|nr:ATP-binding protein [Methanocorpusculum sp.]